MRRSPRIWARRKELLDMYPVPTLWFDSAVADGAIRTVKFGSRKQSRRLYRLGDVGRVLDSLALAEYQREARLAELES